MKRIALKIETRNHDRGCSSRCRYLRWTVRGEQFTPCPHCMIFGELMVEINATYPTRAPKCITLEIPSPEKRRGKCPKRERPTLWERL